MHNSPLQSFAVSPRFKGEILNKIYRIWLLRKFAPVVAAEIVILALLLYQLGKSIFVQQVIENGLSIFFANPPKLIAFFVSSFTHASMGTRLLAIGLIIVLALLIRHLTQGILRLILVRERYFERLKK